MKAQVATDQEGRAAGQAQVKLEIAGGTKAPHAFSDAQNASLESLKPGTEDLETLGDITQRRLQQAVYRDAKYGQARGVWLRKHGLSQAIREVYDGAVQIAEGGVR